MVTADRGLCGGFNTNLTRYATRVLRERAEAGDEVALDLVGRKGRDFFRKRGARIEGQWVLLG